MNLDYPFAHFLLEEALDTESLPLRAEDEFKEAVERRHIAELLDRSLKEKSPPIPAAPPEKKK